MTLNWFKQKQYPDFWNSYIQHFKNQQSNDIASIRFVVFDTETTGLNTNEDRILSIGSITISNFTIEIADCLELYVVQKKYSPNTVPIHGILKEGNRSKISEDEAIRQFLAHIKNAVLVAHHAYFDITMINKCLVRMGLPKLKNKVIDTGVLFKKTTLCKNREKHYSLDELSDFFKISPHDRHTATGDAYITGLIFLKILTFLKNKQRLTLHRIITN